MNTRCPYPQKHITKVISLALLTLTGLGAFADTVDLGTVGGSSGVSAAVTNSLKADRGTASSVAPTQANLSATQPQSFISRSYIEESTPPTGNFNTITAIAPSVASTPSTNGPGLSDQKMSLRGFQDGEYNVTFDGIPFGDTNGPTHHSTAYFPASIIGGMLIERGPGNASNVGYSTYGGSVNLFSKAPSATQVQSAIGSWGTQLEGVSYESGRMAGSDATLQLNLQHMQSQGYLTGSGINLNNFTLKYQRPVSDSSLLTIFVSPSNVTTYVTDNANGPTAAQVKAFGKNYVMNNNPASQGFSGYNFQAKTSDIEYIRLQSDLGNGWQTDNNAYTYAYTNSTVAGQDPSLYGPNGDSSLAITTLAKTSIKLPNNGVPG
jgi:iron complex outermembrane recepter protein